jgi:hypothetical protein
MHNNKGTETMAFRFLKSINKMSYHQYTMPIFLYNAQLFGILSSNPKILTEFNVLTANSKLLTVILSI